MKKQFIRYAGNASINNKSVAIYKLQDGNIMLRAERFGSKIKGSHDAILTKEQYDEMDYDPTNGLVELGAAFTLCGLRDILPAY